jgi:hypothetical protein
MQAVVDHEKLTGPECNAKQLGRIARSGYAGRTHRQPIKLPMNISESARFLQCLGPLTEHRKFKTKMPAPGDDEVQHDAITPCSVLGIHVQFSVTVNTSI